MKEIIRYHLTDTGNAELLADLYSDRLKYDHLRGRWLVWGKHYWLEDQNERVRRIAIKAARERFRMSADIKDLYTRRKVADWAIISEHRNRLDAVIAISKSIRPIADKGNDWDTNPWLFAVANGVIDLQTGKLHKGRRNDRVTLHSRVDYDPEAKYPRWRRFLKEVFNDDQELIDYVWRLAGYSMTGITKEQVYALCHGSGANGKGRFLATLSYVMGDYAYGAPFSTFELTYRATIPNDLAALERRRFVTSSETNEGTRLNEARIKALSGEDEITARYLHREFFSFMPVCKLWLAVNHKPRVKDETYAFWRRVRLIPFLRQFKGAADDKNLGEKLRAEAPGILNWLIAGCLEWQERGLDPVPEAVTIATQEYQVESDPLIEFLEECCIQTPEATAMSADLYREYVSWARDQGLSERERFNSNSFGRRMAARFEKYHTKRGNAYRGVGLLQSNTRGEPLVNHSTAKSQEPDSYPIFNYSRRRSRNEPSMVHPVASSDIEANELADEDV